MQYATSVAVRTTSLKFADPVITNYLHQMSTPLNMTMYFMGTEDMFTGMIHMNCGLKDWKAAILLVNQKAIFKLDTGSSAMSFQKNTTKSVQSHYDYLMLGSWHLEAPPQPLVVKQPYLVSTRTSLMQ